MVNKIKYKNVISYVLYFLIKGTYYFVVLQLTGACFQQ